VAGLREVPAVCKSYMYIVELGLQQVLGLFPQAPNLHLWQMLVMIISNMYQVRQWPGLFTSKTSI